MRRLIFAGAATALLLAGCGATGSPSTAPSTLAPAASAPTAAPQTPIPTLTAIVKWYNGIQTDYTAMNNDMQNVATIAGSSATAKGDYSGLAAACSGFIAVIDTLQGDPPFPTDQGNTLWQETLASYAKAGAECVNAANGDPSQLQQSGLDLVAGNGTIQQINALLKQAIGA